VAGGGVPLFIVHIDADLVVRHHSCHAAIITWHVKNGKNYADTVCGALLVGTSRAQYCSRNCASKAAYARQAEERRAARRARHHARRQADIARGA